MQCNKEMNFVSLPLATGKVNIQELSNLQCRVGNGNEIQL